MTQEAQVLYLAVHAVRHFLVRYLAFADVLERDFDARQRVFGDCSQVVQVVSG